MVGGRAIQARPKRKQHEDERLKFLLARVRCIRPHPCATITPSFRRFTRPSRTTYDRVKLAPTFRLSCVIRTFAPLSCARPCPRTSQLCRRKRPQPAHEGPPELCLGAAVGRARASSAGPSTTTALIEEDSDNKVSNVTRRRAWVGGLMHLEGGHRDGPRGSYRRQLNKLAP